MSADNFWLKVFNVYPNERKVVQRLYLYQFLQGAGIAFFFTSSFAQFLEKFPITELPWVMIWSAVLLWLAGVAYTRLEHSLNFMRFNLIVILFMTASMLVTWVANYQIEQDWFFYFMLAWFNVLYLLNNLQFWGIAALLFDLRQSKRLFAVISAGDIPAKFIGYTLASVLVTYTGTKNLLFIGAACLLASLAFFESIVRSAESAMPAHSHHHHQHKKKSGHHKPLRKLVENITTHKYIRQIAFISLLTGTCVILINYGFYGEVKKAYKHDVALASFIGFFNAGLRILAFFTKMIFTSRLTASFGIKHALLITPIGMLVLTVIIITVNWLTPEEKMIFYLFGFVSMLVDVLRTSFNSPVLLTLMQPLSTHDRLRAHNIVKGIMDPFASLASGIFLLAIIHLVGKVDLMFLCYVLLVLGGLWLLGVGIANRHYLKILINTIGSRFFSREEFDLNDETVINQLRNKMMNGSDLEVISILRMLNSRIDAVAEELIVKLLNHPSDQVKLEVLRLIGNRRIQSARADLMHLMEKNSSGQLRNEGVRTLSKIESDAERLSEYLESSDSGIRKSCLAGMLANPEKPIMEKGQQVLVRLLHSQAKEEKAVALFALTEVNEVFGHPDHSLLLTDADPEIRKLALRAVGKATPGETLSQLFDLANENEKLVLNALQQAGPVSIPHIRDQVLSGHVTDSFRERLIQLCGKIGGNQAMALLLELLEKEPGYTATVVKALHRCKYSTDEKTQEMFEALARKYIVFGVEMLNMQKGLSRRDEHYEVLNSSLHYEIQEIREILLCLFGCMYDREKMNQVKYGLNAHHKESVANAMEIIELTVKKDIGRQFNTMFESTSVEQRCNALRSLFSEKQYGKVEHILARILSEKPVEYYNWTKAWSLYISKKYLHPIEESLFKKYMHSENELLKETALFASPIH